MNRIARALGQALLAAAALITGAQASAGAAVDGIAGPTFNLTAKAAYITTGEGNNLLAWGYASDAGGAFPGTMQYPGPTLIVNQGDTVTINLKNTLPMPVSMVFPGQGSVTATGGQSGLLTREAPADNGQSTVSYSFNASRAGTYLYYSGTRPDLQVEMGLVGALIVRPPGFDPASNRTAYGHPGSGYDQEYLFLLTEIDADIHRQVEFNTLHNLPPDAGIDTSTFFPEYWCINGRTGPDTVMRSGTQAPWLATQPYNSLPRMHPGERLLMRVISAGRDLHPFHHHGNNARMIARDGRLLESSPGAGPDLAVSDFTIKAVPGSTYDAIFEWTGKGLGWDIYGTVAQNPHSCIDGNGDGHDDTTKEWCEDHNKSIPVTLPGQQDLTFGGHWSGSPYLGQFGALPPGQGGMNPTGGYFFMWHSHTERELINFDIFPGGMMTMLIVEPPGVAIP